MNLLQEKLCLLCIAWCSLSFVYHPFYVTRSKLMFRSKYLSDYSRACDSIPDAGESFEIFYKG